MRFKIILLLSISACFILSCNNNEPIYCQYSLSQLLAIDTPQVSITYKDDSIIEVREKAKGGFGGLYRFDHKKNLRFYGFFINDNHFYYSEEYDSKGNVFQKEGVPIVSFDVWRKRDNDTVLFTGSLFSLNKKYEDIEIISNNKDTIRPHLLYKSEIYTNMKEFYFTLPIARKINDLVFYATGAVINTCNQKREFFSDTVSFNRVKL
jgi:hypothetical protein